MPADDCPTMAEVKRLLTLAGLYEDLAPTLEKRSPIHPAHDKRLLRTLHYLAGLALEHKAVSAGYGETTCQSPRI